MMTRPARFFASVIIASLPRTAFAILAIVLQSGEALDLPQSAFGDYFEKPYLPLSVMGFRRPYRDHPGRCGRLARRTTFGTGMANLALGVDSNLRCRMDVPR